MLQTKDYKHRNGFRKYAKSLVVEEVVQQRKHKQQETILN